MKKNFSLSAFLSLQIADVTTIVFLNLLSLLHLFFYTRIADWYVFVSLNSALSAAIFFLAQKTTLSSPLSLRLLRHWYLAPMILYIFKETYFMVHPIHPADFDWLLINIDYSIFGVHPTQWIMRFANPVMTELLQISYASYYILLVTPMYELYREEKFEDFYWGAFLIIYGFYLSYIGYFLLPAVGPRFTLHNFLSVDAELPGIFFTQYLRDFVNAGESIPKGIANAVQFAQRDVFPSGHTQLTLVTLYVAFTKKIKSRWVMLIFGLLLIVSTVYLRYHYVVDVACGILFFIFTIWSGKKINSWWNSVRAVKVELN